MAQFQNFAEAKREADRQRTNYRLAKMAHDAEAQRIADRKHREALQAIRNF